MRSRGYFLKLFLLYLLATGDPKADLTDSTDLITTNIVNDTLRCSARNIQGPVQSPHQPIAAFILRCVLVNYYILVAFFAVVLNGFVIFLVIKFKVLRTLPFAFAIQIAVINIISWTILLPSSTVSVIANQWLLGEAACVVVGVVSSATTLRNLLLLIFVTDRFCSIFMPYFYPRYQAKILCCEVTVAYILSAISATIFGVLDCYSYVEIVWTCLASACNSKCQVYVYILSSCIQLPSSIIPILFYSLLFWKARKALRAETCEALRAQQTEQKIRATVTFFLMFLCTFIVSALPILVVLLGSPVVTALNAEYSTMWFILNTIAFNTIALVPIADPIFILRNKDVKEAMAKLTWMPTFGCH